MKVWHGSPSFEPQDVTPWTEKLYTTFVPKQSLISPWFQAEKYKDMDKHLIDENFWIVILVSDTGSWKCSLVYTPLCAWILEFRFSFYYIISLFNFMHASMLSELVPSPGAVCCWIWPESVSYQNQHHAIMSLAKFTSRTDWEVYLPAAMGCRGGCLIYWFGPKCNGTSFMQMKSGFH